MARQLRVECEGALYHVTARGNARQAIYKDDRDRDRFVDLLAWEVAQRFGVFQSRVSHIQQAVETGPLTRQQRRAMRECKVKQ